MRLSRPFLRLLRLTFLSLAFGIASFAHAADALDSVLARGVLRAAVPRDFPPFGSVDTELQLIGYDIDVAKLLARELGVRLELVPVASANRILYLKTRKVDVIISNLGKSPEREKVIQFSAAYAPYFNGVFGPADVNVSDFAALAGKTVGVARGSFEDLQITQSAPASVILRRYDDQNATISAFLSGQVQLIGSGNLVAAAILKRNPPKRPELKFLIKQSPCHIGLNLDEPRLLARINEIIATSKQNGALAALARTWLASELPPDF